MSVREGLEFETAIESDSAPLQRPGGERPGRGRRGRSTSCATPPAAASPARSERDRGPGGGRHPAGRSEHPDRTKKCGGACEILGLDPLYVANEGKCLVIVAREAAEAVLAAMRRHPLGQEAAIIGEVVADHPGKVVLRSRIGGLRIVDMLSGEQLPRIC